MDNYDMMKLMKKINEGYNSQNLIYLGVGVLAGTVIGIIINHKRMEALMIAIDKKNTLIEKQLNDIQQQIIDQNSVINNLQNDQTELKKIVATKQTPKPYNLSREKV